MTENATINESDTNIAKTKAFTVSHVKESTSGINIDPTASLP